MKNEIKIEGESVIDVMISKYKIQTLNSEP